MNEIHPPTPTARRILMIVFGSLAAIVLLLAVTSGGDDVAYDDQSEVTSTVGGSDSESVTGLTDVEVGVNGADGESGSVVQSENGSRSVVQNDGGTVVFEGTPADLVEAYVTEEGSVTPDEIEILADRTPFLREGYELVGAAGTRPAAL